MRGRRATAWVTTILQFLWDRTSQNAACVVIDFAQHMDAKDLREIASYLEGLAADREYQSCVKQP